MSNGRPSSEFNSDWRLDRDLSTEQVDGATMFGELHQHLCRWDQSHLLRWWPELDIGQRKALAEQIQSIDLEQLDGLYRQSAVGDSPAVPMDRISVPTTVTAVDNSHCPNATFDRGAAVLRNGQAGVVIVAGGQGSRLGFSGPKGCFPVGPVVGTTLFQILIEKVLASSRKFGVTAPVFVMTSPTTHDETVSFLDRTDWFGLEQSARHVFCQGTMPAMDFDGRILMKSPSQISVSPDGHGGIVAASRSSGMLDLMSERGVEYLFYCQIDNAAAPVLDPVLMGMHVREKSEVTALVTEKFSAFDPVGTVVSVDGRLHVLEYTLISEEVANQRNSDGELRFKAANTGMHILDRSFLTCVAGRAESMPFHPSKKSIPFMDKVGRTITPSEPNGIKFEQFFFDLFPHADRSLVIEVDEPSAFLPLKDSCSTATATSPSSVRRRLSDLHRQWLIQAGVDVSRHVTVEISPLFATNAQEVKEGLRVSGRKFPVNPSGNSLYVGDREYSARREPGT